MQDLYIKGSYGSPTLIHVKSKARVITFTKHCSCLQYNKLLKKEKGNQKMLCFPVQQGYTTIVGFHIIPVAATHPMHCLRHGYIQLYP